MDSDLCSQCHKKVFRKGYGAVQTSSGILCIFCAVRKLKRASRESTLISVSAQKKNK